MLRVSREIHVPLLKYFKDLPEETLLALTVQSTAELLTYFCQNRVPEFIDKSVQSWLENQNKLIQYAEIVIEDISTIDGKYNQ